MAWQAPLPLPDFDVIGTDNPVEVYTERRLDGFVLKANRPGAQLHLEFRVRAPVSFRSSHASNLRWSFANGLTHLDAGLYRSIAWFLKFNRGEPNAGWAMRQLVKDLAMHAAQCCDQAARATVLRFCQHLRETIYTWIVEDSTGRIGQMAAACPGVLIMAYAFAERGAAPGQLATDRTLAQIKAGVRLKRIIGEQVEAWFEVAAILSQERLVDQHHRNIWQWAAVQSGWSRERMAHQQRLLIRRAGTWVPSAFLLMPPPMFFRPEDIPTRPRENSRWFRTVKTFWHYVRPSDPANANRRIKMVGLVSRNARHPALRTAPERRRILQELEDYTRLVRPGIDRTAKFDRLLMRSTLWHTQMASTLDIRLLRYRMPGLKVDPNGDFELPTPPLPAWRQGDAIIVEPLRRASQILLEGRRQSNCVASYLPDIIKGEIAIYTALIHGRRFTLEIRNVPGARPVLSQVKGHANRAPTIKEYRALLPFIKAIKDSETLPQAKKPGQQRGQGEAA